MHLQHNPPCHAMGITPASRWPTDGRQDEPIAHLSWNSPGVCCSGIAFKPCPLCQSACSQFEIHSIVHPKRPGNSAFLVHEL
jgi:hypothetical protein